MFGSWKILSVCCLDFGTDEFKFGSKIELMKKTLFIIFWVITFFIVGLIVFGVFSYAMVESSPRPTDPTTLTDNKVRFIIVVDWLFPIGLPTLALILGIFGKLPGTRRISN